MSAIEGLLATIGAKGRSVMNEAMNLPNPGRVVASGVDRITDPSYPVDAALRQWVSNVPAFQPTLGGMLQKTGTKLLDTGAEFVTALQNGDYESAINSPIFPMGGMTVFHGSPHKFDAFDLSKIGTGEGAQAYGHGLYFAENPGVAKGYATKLSQPDFLTIEGLPKDMAEEAQTTFADMLRQYNVGSRTYPPTARDALDQVMLDLDRGAKVAAQSGDFEKFNALSDARTKVWRAKDATPKAVGNLYHVDIPDDEIAKMLDWDKPLSEQPESVRKAIESVREAYRANPALDVPYIYDDMTGEQLYKEIATVGYRKNGEGANHAKYASDEMKKLGIPGIKYLDNGSRGAGDGTRNLVLFDDKLAKVLKRE